MPVAAVGMCVMLQVAAVYMPLLQKVLHTAPPAIADFGVIAGSSLSSVIVVDFLKLIAFQIRSFQ